MIFGTFDLTALGAGTFTSSEFAVDNSNGQGFESLGLEIQQPVLAGGTSVDVYVQTSFDEGATYGDILNFHATTGAAATKRANLNAGVSVTTFNTPGDGALTANTAIDGILGGKFRVKVVIVGAYTGAPKVKVFGAPRGRLRKL